MLQLNSNNSIEPRTHQTKCVRCFGSTQCVQFNFYFLFHFWFHCCECVCLCRISVIFSRVITQFLRISFINSFHEDVRVYIELCVERAIAIHEIWKLREISDDLMLVLVVLVFWHFFRNISQFIPNLMMNWLIRWWEICFDFLWTNPEAKATIIPLNNWLVYVRSICITDSHIPQIQISK